MKQDQKSVVHLRTISHGTHTFFSICISLSRRSIIRSTVFLHITPSLLSTDVSSGSLLIARIELLYPTTASSSGIASPLIDRNTRSVVLMMSASGGMDIEEVARQTPEKIIRYSINPFIGLPDYLARRFAFSLFPQMEQAGKMAAILQELYKIFMENDASLVEVNPLALTKKGTLMAIDAKIVFDDNALYRHPEVHALFDPTEEERIEADAKDKGFSYVHMDGNIGCMVNGAGLAMATMDMIKLYGGQPANFLDIGGSSNPVKVIEAMKLLLQDEKVKVVLINIFGGITRCDDVAMGLLQAFEQINSNIPVIVRLTGTNEHIGRELLRNYSRFQIATTMKEAALMALKA